MIGRSRLASTTWPRTRFNIYHEFLWWDPTGLDGYPALVNLTHGWFNYLNPLVLPGHVFVWIAISLLHWPLVTAVQVQLFSLAYLTSLIFVILLAREVIRSPLARLLPPLVFTLGASANQFFMLAQHGPALAPTLGVSIRAHLFLATSHAILAVRIPGLSVVLPRIYQ